MNLKTRKKLLTLILSGALAASSLSGLAWAEVSEEDSFIIEEEPVLQEETEPEILDEETESLDILEEVDEDEADMVEEAAESVGEAAEDNDGEETAESAVDEVYAEDDLLTDEPEEAGETGEEAYYYFQLAEVERLLPFSNRIINKTGNVWVMNKENPDGAEKEYQIYDVQVKNANTSKPSVEIKAEANGWRIIVNENPGEASITQFYYDIHGNKQTHTSKIIVVHELWEMNVRSDIGFSVPLLAGEERPVFANLVHLGYDQEGNHRLPLEGVTYKWIVEDNSVAKVVSKSDGTAVATGLKEGLTDLRCEAYFNNAKVAEASTMIYVDTLYGYLLPSKIDPFHTGKTITVNPKVMEHRKDENGKNQVVEREDVRFSWDYSPEELEIRDKNGVLLNYDKNSRKFTYTDACEGKGVSFTIKRLTSRSIEYWLYMEFKNLEGEWEKVDEQHYTLDPEWYEFLFIGPAGPSTPLYTNQTLTFTADTSQLDNDGLDYRIEWSFGHEYNDAGGFVDPITGDFFTTSGKHNEKIVIDGAKAARNQKIMSRGGVDLLAFAKIGNENVGRSKNKHLELRNGNGIKSAVITGLFNSSKGGDLRWKAEGGADNYVIYRTNGGKTEKIATVPGSAASYMDTSIKDNCWGKVYVYYVCPKVGDTVAARENGATLQRLAPMAINYNKNDKNGAAVIKWVVSSGSNKANGYELQYAESKEDLFGQKGTFRKTSLNGRNSLSKTVTGLKKGKTYYFRVRAYVNYTHSVTKVTTKTWSQYSDVKSVKITK